MMFCKCAILPIRTNIQNTFHFLQCIITKRPLALSNLFEFYTLYTKALITQKLTEGLPSTVSKLPMEDPPILELEIKQIEKWHGLSLDIGTDLFYNEIMLYLIWGIPCACWQFYPAAWCSCVNFDPLFKQPIREPVWQHLQPSPHAPSCPSLLLGSLDQGACSNVWVLLWKWHCIVKKNMKIVKINKVIYSY